jgi:hypothetical protein
MPKTGAIGGVIASAAAGARAEDPEQLELMPPTRANMTAAEQERVETAVKRDRAGRPPGAQNKATREMLDFVRKMCGDPLERRFRYAMHTPESLSIELGCTKLEAFDRLDRMWSELSRLFYAPLAPVDGQGNAVVPRLTMLFGGQNAAAADGSVEPPWIAHLRTVNGKEQEKQALPQPADGMSHDASPGDHTSD